MSYDQDLYKEAFQDGFRKGILQTVDKTKALYRAWLQEYTNETFEQWLDRIGEEE